MPQRPNPTISRFRDRVQWVVDNLDPDPTYRRFVSNVNDVAAALGDFRDAVATKFERVPGLRTWQNALQHDSVPVIYLEWLCSLFPDLTRGHLEAPSWDDFLELGAEIEKYRDQWRPAIRLYAESRAQLSTVSKAFYRDVDRSKIHDIDDLAFPLITLPNWIRSTPVELTASTELEHLREPLPGIVFEKRNLPGLRGTYGTYKGSLAYATRRPVRPEPQHNGEIFCVEDIVFDQHGFIGFTYYLSKYFEYINTSEILGAELAMWIVQNHDQKEMPTLPLRRAPSAAFDMKWRAAYPGVNCLTIVRGYSESLISSGDYFLLHLRDETQLQAQNAVHVVPAGGHQGFAKGSRREDTAIWRTIVREFCEELFDQEALNKQPDTWGDFLLYRDVQRIVSVFFNDVDPAARIWMHGFGLDPVTLKPEILVTIVIDWSKVKARWIDAKFKFNWELRKRMKKSGTRHQWVQLSQANLLRQAKGRVQSIDDVFLDTLPAGAACMMLTAKHYQTLGLT